MRFIAAAASVAASVARQVVRQAHPIGSVAVTLAGLTARHAHTIWKFAKPVIIEVVLRLVGYALEESTNKSRKGWEPGYEH